MIVEKPDSYLFSDEALARLHDFIDSTTLLAFDLDGTLAPIVAEPSSIIIPGEVHAGLIHLSRIAAVAIVTGRARDDAISHLGFNPLFVVGNHGAEGLPGPDETKTVYIARSKEWEKQLRLALPDADKDGIVIENKGATISLHYRNSPDHDIARQMILESVKNLVPPPRRISGKQVENLVPQESPNKGEALSIIMRHLGFRKALFIGDDETDEDVFRLKDDAIFGIRVGKNQWSTARYFIREQDEIGPLICEIISVIENR